MKLNKIKNIDLQVCSCEQKLAYNFAFNWYDTTISTEELIQYIGEKWETYDIPKRYNKEAVLQILQVSYERYKNTKYHIMNSYEEVGKMFTLN